MITPLESSIGTASTTLMQSMIDRAEEQRLEEEKKARKDTKEDDILKVRAAASKSHAALNDKVNAHFFGALKADDNPMAELMSRFLNILDVKRDDGESDADFSTRVADSLTLVEMIGKDEANLPLTSSIPGGEQKITLARFRVTVKDIDAALDGSDENPTEMTKMAARFVTRYGLTQDDGERDGDYSKRIGETMASVRKSMPESIADLEKKAGLDALGMTADQMVEAIRNPSGLAAQAIQETLDDKVRDEGISSDDQQIALQRMEDIADPKSIEELKLERVEQPDPTRVENAETRKEREEDMRKLEAVKKLDDVEDVQETVKAVNDALLDNPTPDAGDPSKAGTPVLASVDSGDLLVTLAAGAEAAQVAENVEKAVSSSAAVGVETIDPEAGKTDAANEAADEKAMDILVARSGPGYAAAPVGDALTESGILPVKIDENGIYAILKRQTEEARAA